MATAYEGIRIVDFTQIEQGPVGTQVLADFGAEVIKIERIDIGAMGRTSTAHATVRGLSCSFAADNRNKKSLTLDLKQPEAREIVYKLVKVSDVVASNFRPGVMERLGFGYDALRQVNPRIICAYASGYGQTGPYREKGGQDLIAQAMGGVMALTGEAVGPPAPAGTYIADYLAAMHFAIGIMAALAARDRTGDGQEVDTSLLNAMVAVHLHEGTSYLNAGVVYPRPRRGIAHANFGPLYGTYQTSDGKWVALAGMFIDRPWRRVCTALGADNTIIEDPRFQAAAGQVEHEAAGQAILQSLFARQTRDEAVRLLEEQGIIAGPAYDYPEVFADPQVIHNGMIMETEHPTAGKIKVVGNPVKLSKTPGTMRLPPPTIGQHNEEILRFLGYAEQRIRELQQRGVVGSENLKAKAGAPV